MNNNNSHLAPLIVVAGATLIAGILSAAALVVVEDAASRSESSTTLDKASGVIAACLHAGSGSKRSRNDDISPAMDAGGERKKYIHWDQGRA
jgi:hypothetical protein